MIKAADFQIEKLRLSWFPKQRVERGSQEIQSKLFVFYF
jgi:hypothetical protein